MGFIPADSEMTVNDWFDYWIKHLICDLSPDTRRNYQERYKINIQPVIGNMKMTDAKSMHCKIVLNQIEVRYAGGAIKQVYIAMEIMLRAAVCR